MSAFHSIGAGFAICLPSRDVLRDVDFEKIIYNHEYRISYYIFSRNGTLDGFGILEACRSWNNKKQRWYLTHNPTLLGYILLSICYINDGVLIISNHDFCVSLAGSLSLIHSECCMSRSDKLFPRPRVRHLPFILRVLTHQNIDRAHTLFDKTVQTLFCFFHGTMSP